MDRDDKKLAQIRMFLEEAEEKIQAARRILFEQVYKEQAENLNTSKSATATIIEGIFDGEGMIDKDGQKYSVPANYSSKSKLVAGDRLKLTIAEDGSFVFKQIGPIDRKRTIGKLTHVGDEWIVMAEGKKYRCLPASVSYFKAKSGDKIAVILPKIGEADWAAIENTISE